MRKTHWLLAALGFILLGGGMVLGCLFLLQFGSESFSREKLVNASEEAYRFDPQTIFTKAVAGRDNIFVQVPFLDKFPPPIFTDVLWQQSDYLLTIDLFMKYILHENRDSWGVIDISSVNLCSDSAGLSNLTVRIQKGVPSHEESHRIEAHINIMPQSGIIELLRREYAPNEGGERTIRWNDIKIPAEQALEIAEQNGGAVVRQALNNECRIIISLKAGIQKNDWWIYYEPINEPSVFEVAVDAQTGKYRILREFEK